MGKRLALLCGLLVLALALSSGAASASSFDWKTYESEHFIIFFQPGYEWQAQQTIYYLEEHLPRVMELTGNSRPEKYRIILQDVGIDSNGWASSWENKISIFTNSPASGETLSSATNWFHYVSGHELTHLAQMNNYSDSGAIMPVILGNFFSPNYHVPGWIIEGITVYYESSLNPYEGRLNDGYYDALVAAKAQAGKLPSILEAAYGHASYPLGQWYTFGGVFMRYLAETYGEEKLGEFFRANGQNPLGLLGSLSPDLGIDRAARKVFGKSFDRLFVQWAADESAEHQSWRVDGRPVREDTHRGYFTHLTMYHGKLYYIHARLVTPEPFSYGKKLELVEYDPTNGTERILTSLPSLSGAQLQIVNDTIYYLCGEPRPGYANTEEQGYGLTGILYAYNLLTGKETPVLSAPIEAFAVLENGEILYTTERHDAFGAEIWKSAGKAQAKIGVTDQMIAEILPYQDHYIVVSKKNFGSWNINHFQPGDLSMRPVIDTPWIESGIALHGDTLYFTANYAHISALYSCNLLTGDFAQLTSGGYAYGGAPLGDEIFFQSVTADGDAIYHKALQPVPCIPGERERITVPDYTDFVTALKEGTAPLANWASLLVPYQRLLPSLAEGEDALGLTSYSLTYSPYVGLDAAFSTDELMPLRLSVSNTIVNANKDRVTELALSLPLYRSAQFGLRSANLSGETNFTDSAVSVDATFGLPDQTLFFRLSRDTQGIYAAGTSYQYRFDDSSLRFGGTFALLGSAGNTHYGYRLNADYTHKLKEIREGFWHSTIYLSDVYGNVNCELNHEGENRLTADVQFETSMGFHMSAVPQLGVTYSFSSGTWQPYFEFNFGF